MARELAACMLAHDLMRALSTLFALPEVLNSVFSFRRCAVRGSIYAAFDTGSQLKALSLCGKVVPPAKGCYAICGEMASGAANSLLVVALRA